MTERRSLSFEICAGSAITPLLPDLARLRTAVFRDWPYLYDGDEEYEQVYLQTYANSPGAAAIVARDGGRIVGAATCLPLEDEDDNVTAPFRARGWDLGRFFYFGESVLLPEYRGLGAGVAFFAHREAHARRAAPACEFATFCSVLRPPDHPARPADRVPLDEFWRRRGYTPRPDLACTMAWKDVGEPHETEKTLTFWMKSLTGGSLPQ